LPSLTEIREDYVTAERFYKRALQISPNNCYILFNYAVFLKKTKLDQNATEYFEKALTQPHFESMDEIFLLKDYSNYLQDQLHDASTAETYSHRFSDMKSEWEKKNQPDHGCSQYILNSLRNNKSDQDYGYIM